MSQSLEILVLSDLHFGNPKASDTTDYLDVDIRLGSPKDAEVQLWKRLKDQALGRPFDYLIIAGDLTYRYAPDGFVEFKRFIKTGRDAGYFPKDDRAIIVSPGNHDVSRKETTKSAKYKKFREATHPYPRALCEDMDGIVSTLSFKGKTKTSTMMNLAESKETRRAPFILDSSHRLMMYAFDSCSAIGVRPKFIADVKDANVRAALEKWLELSPGVVDDPQLVLFRRVVTVATNSPHVDDFARFFKIAICHHQVADLPSRSTEIKLGPVDHVINAVPLKQELDDAGFSLLVTGHRHYESISYDMGYRENDTEHGLWILSCGSMSDPSKDGRAGFARIRVDLDDFGQAVSAFAHSVSLRATAPPPATQVWPRRATMDERRHVGTLGAFATDPSGAMSQLRIMGDLSAAAYLRLTVESQSVLNKLSRSTELNEMIALSEDFRWMLWGDMNEALARTFRGLEPEQFRHYLGRVAKLVTFDDTPVTVDQRVVYPFTARTDYSNLRNIAPHSEETALVSIPIIQIGTSRSPSAIELWVRNRAEGDTESGRSRGSFTRVAKGDRRVLATPVGSRIFFRATRKKNMTLDYRMQYKHDGFGLSEKGQRAHFRGEQKSSPKTYNRNYNSFDVKQVCAGLKLTVAFPATFERVRKYKPDRDFHFIVWPSREAFTDLWFGRQDDIRRNADLRSEDWSLDLRVLDDGSFGLVLEVNQRLWVGHKYGILWKPPLP